MLTTHREQLFWISFGRIWAINYKTGALVQQVRTNPHSPGMYRVQGTLRNIPEFAESFNCPEGTTVSGLAVCLILACV
jgi:endothelin-converting enzyme